MQILPSHPFRMCYSSSPLVWVFVVVAGFLCFGSLFEGGLFVSVGFVWVFLLLISSPSYTAFYAFSSVEA